MVHQNPSARRFLVPLVHVSAWAFLFAVPYLLNNQHHGQGFPPLPALEWVRLGLVAVIFYVNYFWLIPNLYFRHRTAIFVVVNLCVAALFPFVLQNMFPLMAQGPQIPNGMHQPNHFQPFPDTGPKPPEKVNRMGGQAIHPSFFPMSPIGPAISGFFMVCLTVGMAMAMRLVERFQRDEKIRQLLENEHLRSELSYLKLQLSPHFLFNTLNNIYALAGLAPEKAQIAVHHLSKMLRYLLYETDTDTVPIQGEVAFLESYIQLMRLRLPAHVSLFVDMKVEDEQAPIAPLLSLPLIENAFKHGVHPVEPSRINILLQEKDHDLNLRILNSNYPKTDLDHSGSGLGLSNLAKRLELLYHGLFRYHVSPNPNEYVVELSIHLISK
ncbi:MAG TPA: histidine kinase [Fibrobacteraceae bacterium]|nr:histidine kinase [Fibrobacteraceae bacterium]